VVQADSQDAALAFLAAGRSHGLPEGTVRRIDTHGAVVFLAGETAYKVKRAVKLPYFDYSTLALRAAACAAELALNRPLAPTLYRRVDWVTRRPDGCLALGGEGERLEPVLVMRRFPDDALLDAIAARGGLERGLVLRLALRTAAMHLAARPAPHGADAAEMARAMAVNDRRLVLYRGTVLPDAQVDALRAERARWFGRLEGHLDRRRREGFVRQCHGDLHLRNLVLLDGEPTPFDAIEFNTRLTAIDCLYDLAFLLMDLWSRRLWAQANLLFNRYLLLTDDLEGLCLLPLYLAERAVIRAHVSATMAEHQSAAGRTQLEAEARRYGALALAFLRPPAPGLLAVGGYSGSGKSTLAQAIAPQLGPTPGALVCRSDEIRKRLFGHAPEAALPTEAYAPAVSARVYRQLRRRSARALAGGHSAIADAVHDRPYARAALRRLAMAAGVPYLGLWLDAPAERLIERVGQRRDDASDADAAVVASQLRERRPVPKAWHRIDAAGGFDAVQTEALRWIVPALPVNPLVVAADQGSMVADR